MSEPEEVKEEIKEETVEQRRARFLANYQSVIEKDQKRMAENAASEQRPFGRAYLSLDPFNRSNNVQVEEEKKSQDATYLVDRNAKGKSHSEHLRAQIRRNVIEFGYSTQKVDEVFQDVKELPDSLIKAFYDMTRADIKERISKDEDFKDLQQRKAEGNCEKSYLEDLEKL